MFELELIFIIFLIQVTYVSIFTLRLIFMVKGLTYFASLVSMGEVFVHVIGLSLVLQNLDQPLNVLAYCLGFATGILVGSMIERWMALGYITVQVITTNLNPVLCNQLRDSGYGVTSWLAEGREGYRQMISILVKRKNQRKLFNCIKEIDPKAFIVSYEPASFHGGFLMKRVR